MWYTFDYDGKGFQITIRMAVSPIASVGFSVWTPEEVASWARDGKERPIGRGSANSYFGGDLIWSGLIVEQVSGRSYGQFLREHIFTSLSMNVARVLSGRWPDSALNPGIREKLSLKN